MKVLSMKTSLSSSQKPNKFVLQHLKACKSSEHFQLGYRKDTENKNHEIIHKKLLLRTDKGYLRIPYEFFSILILSALRNTVADDCPYQ